MIVWQRVFLGVDEIKSDVSIVLGSAPRLLIGQSTAQGRDHVKSVSSLFAVRPAVVWKGIGTLQSLGLRNEWTHFYAECIAHV